VADTIRLTFTKLAGKYDKLLIQGHGRELSVDCPKQGIIPHDLIHYAIEKVMHLRGFVRLVSEGKPEAELRNADYDALLGEALVETLQAEMWSGGPADDAAFLEMLAVTMDARGQKLRPLAPEILTKVRAEIASLTEAWSSVTPYKTLVLELPA
jgi:hypothetical protein